MARIALRARTALRANGLLQVGESRSIPPHPIMPRLPRHVAPTLVDAVRALEGDAERGFVFVRPDGTERLRSFQEMAAEAASRAASLAALGLEKGDRVALVIPGRRRVRPLAPGDALCRARAGAAVAAALDEQHRGVPRHGRAHRAGGGGRSSCSRPRRRGRFSRPSLGQVDGLRAIVTVEELAASNGSHARAAAYRPRPTTWRSSSSRAAAPRAPRA